MPDLRTDECTGALVIVAPGRASRPDTFRRAAPTLPPTVETCPFCPGHENQTPPEVARTGDGPPDTPGWRVRVVPNLYPITAAHEVVVLSPAHDRSFGQLEPDRAREVLFVLRDRVAWHHAHGAVHVQAFVNHGKEAGASIEHPHAQLVGLDFVPPRIETLRDRHAHAEVDLVGVAIASARASARVVIDGDVVVWCPPGPTPFTMRCALADNDRDFPTCSDDALTTIAAAVHDALRRLHHVAPGYPYNAVFVLPPADGGRGFHWWVDIVPRTALLAGFEQGTGVFVNPLPPEDAAEALR